MLCGSLDGRGVWERMNTFTHMAEPLHHEPESITTLLTVYSPVQKKTVNEKGDQKLLFAMFTTTNRSSKMKTEN